PVVAVTEEVTVLSVQGVPAVFSLLRAARLGGSRRSWSWGENSSVVAGVRCRAVRAVGFILRSCWLVLISRTSAYLMAARSHIRPQSRPTHPALAQLRVRFFGGHRTWTRAGVRLFDLYCALARCSRRRRGWRMPSRVLAGGSWPGRGLGPMRWWR